MHPLVFHCKAVHSTARQLGSGQLTVNVTHTAIEGTVDTATAVTRPRPVQNRTQFVRTSASAREQSHAVVRYRARSAAVLKRPMLLLLLLLVENIPKTADIQDPKVAKSASERTVVK